MSMNVVGRILSLKPRWGVSSCEIHYFHILMSGSEGLGIDVHNFEILITVGIFFIILIKALCMGHFPKNVRNSPPHPLKLPSSFLSTLLEYVQNISKHRMYFSSVESVFPHDHLYKPW